MSKNKISIEDRFTPKQTITTQKMKFSIKDYYSKCDQIHSFLVTFTE